VELGLKKHNQNVDFSIVIPAFNEQEFIGDTLDALTNNPASLSYEIVVVDNGSTDMTTKIALDKGVKVVSLLEGSISAVRNKGVSETSGEILVFMDADIVVSQSWHKKLPEIKTQLIREPMIVR